MSACRYWAIGVGGLALLAGVLIATGDWPGVALLAVVFVGWWYLGPGVFDRDDPVPVEPNLDEMKPAERNAYLVGRALGKAAAMQEAQARAMVLGLRVGRGEDTEDRP